MIRKLIVVLLTGVFCLLGVTSVLAVAYNEAPMLRTLVAAGELPPVEERLPREPYVLEPIEEIGRYGGTIHAFATSELPYDDLQGQLPYLLRMTEDGRVVGNLAKGYKLSDDYKTFTLYLREGGKWSDGAPFTADDILFKIEDITWNENVDEGWTGAWTTSGIKTLKRIDEYTVRFEFDEPYPSLPLKLATWQGSEWVMYAPKHYLERWHIKYNAEADELAKKEGFGGWGEAFHYHWEPIVPKDMDKPTMYSWDLEVFTLSGKVFVRNPYYWQVDTAGNQLPYIDKVVISIVDVEVYQLKIIAGEADVAYVGTSFENYPLYQENEERGDYRVHLIPGIFGSRMAFGIHQTIDDPILRGLFRDVRFRQALSLAINREEINNTVYYAQAVPRQATTLPTASFYKKEWGESYAQYDLEKANRLLDEMGLTERDKKGFRLGPDGKSILLLVEFPEGESTATLELVREYWEAIGLQVSLKPRSGDFFFQRATAPDHAIMAQPLYGSDETFSYFEGPLRTTEHQWDTLWAEWQDTEGQAGEEPPEKIKQFYKWEKQWSETVFGTEEYRELGEKLFDFFSENLYIIGTVGLLPQVYIANKNIGNVPKEFAPAQTDWPGDLGYEAHQLFFKE